MLQLTKDSLKAILQWAKDSKKSIAAGLLAGASALVTAAKDNKLDLRDTCTIIAAIVVAGITVWYVPFKQTPPQE